MKEKKTSQYEFSEDLEIFFKNHEFKSQQYINLNLRQVRKGTKNHKLHSTSKYVENK